MVVLKKIQAATLVETLVASALIVMVFLIASVSFNSIFEGVATNNDREFQARVQELSYLAGHGILALPYSEENKKWEITIWQDVEALWLDGRFLANEDKDVEIQLLNHE